MGVRREMWRERRLLWRLWRSGQWSNPKRIHDLADAWEAGWLPTPHDRLQFWITGRIPR